MSTSALLLTPWRATRAPVRWIMGSLYLIACLSAIGIVVFGPTASRGYDAAMAMYFGTFYAWAFLMSSSVLLAADAHHLRIPRLPRQVATSLLFYGVLCSVIPALGLALAGASVLPIAVSLAMTILASLVFAWMPQYLAILFAFLPALMLHDDWWPLPGPRADGYLAWAWPALLVGAAVVAWRWRVLVRAGDHLDQLRCKPMVANFRRADGMWSGGNGLFASSSDQGRALRQLPAWLTPSFNLKHVGPERPGRAMRVLLGGWYVPKTLRGYATSSLSLFPLLAIFVVMLLQNHGAGARNWRVFFAVIGPSALISTASYGVALVTLLTVMRMTYRWRRSNTELPLFALLPGLGDASTVKRLLLREAVGLPLMVQAVLSAVVLAVPAWLGASTLVLLAMAVTQLGVMALLPILLIRIFGGRPLTPWVAIIGCVVMMLLINANVVLPMLSTHASRPALNDLLAEAVIAVWLLIAVAMWVVARSGWQALHERPHPFIVNPAR